MWCVNQNINVTHEQKYFEMSLKSDLKNWESVMIFFVLNYQNLDF